MDALSDARLFGFSFWFYLAAFLGFSVYVAFRKEIIGRLASGAMIAGFVPHTAGIVLEWRAVGHAPISDMFEYASLMSWMAVAMFGAFLLRYRQLVLGVLIAPAVLLIVVSSSLLPRDVAAAPVAEPRSAWLAVHVILSALAEAAFAVAGVAGVLYLWRERSVGRAAVGEPGSCRTALDRLDDVNFRAVSLGYPLFTVGALFAGSVWAWQAWEGFWGSDPKLIGSAGIWLFYTAHLWARHRKGWKGARPAWWSAIGFGWILIGFVGGQFAGGLHVFR